MGLFEVSRDPGRREHLVRQAKGSACHPVPCDKAVELLVAVCACSSEQAADARSLRKSGNSSTDLQKKKSIQDHLNIKTFLTQEALTGGHCSGFGQQSPIP